MAKSPFVEKDEALATRLQKKSSAPRFHFVEAYERLVARLLGEHSFDKAMSMAVGGDYERVGQIEKAILTHAGLRDGDHVFDLGCGSGRLAHALGADFRGDYFGTDVVQALIDYAARKSPKSFRFKLHRELSIPAPDGSVDIACAFSVFTHLHHAESHLYLKDMHRALKPGGRVIFSFLEFSEPAHWEIFEGTAAGVRHQTLDHLNMFIERPVIDLWRKRLGFECVEFVGSSQAPWNGGPLGQAVVILKKP